MAWRVGWPALSPAWMRAAFAPALAFIATSANHAYLYDFWHHLARGRAMVETRGIVNRDLFTCTIAGRPIQDIGWLSQVFYYVVYSRAGLPVLELINSLLIALAIGIIVHIVWRETGSMGIAAVAGTFAFLGAWQSLTLRPQTLSLVLFALLYDLLSLAEERIYWLLFVPLVMALWVNLHGAFVAGLILVGGFAAGATWNAWPGGLRRRRLWCWWLCVLAAGAATLANPYGWGAYHFVSQTATAATARPITEWLPPSPDLWVGKFWIVSLVLVVLSLAAGPRPRARDVILILCILPLAASSVRMVVWWAIIITPVLARTLAGLRPAEAAPAEAPGTAPAVCFAAIIGAALFCAPGLDRFNPLLPAARRAPSRTDQSLDGIVTYMSEHDAPGAIFCRFEWGALLNYRLGSGFPVFMDGRIDAYPDRVWEEYAAVTTARPTWLGILDRYDIKYLVLDQSYHAESGLMDAVQISGQWRQVHSAGEAVLFVRNKTTGPVALGATPTRSASEGYVLFLTRPR
jgi:hypothetical protein